MCEVQPIQKKKKTKATTIQTHINWKQINVQYKLIGQYSKTQNTTFR